MRFFRFNTALVSRTELNFKTILLGMYRKFGQEYEQFRVKPKKPAENGTFQCLFSCIKFAVFKVSSLWYDYRMNLRENYFAQMMKYMKNVYHIDRQIEQIIDNRLNPTYKTSQIISLVLVGFSTKNEELQSTEFHD